jgi:hypothetical protein
MSSTVAAALMSVVSTSAAAATRKLLICGVWVQVGGLAHRLLKERAHQEDSTPPAKDEEKTMYEMHETTEITEFDIDPTSVFEDDSSEEAWEWANDPGDLSL